MVFLSIPQIQCELWTTVKALSMIMVNKKSWSENSCELQLRGLITGCSNRTISSKWAVRTLQIFFWVCTSQKIILFTSLTWHWLHLYLVSWIKENGDLFFWIFYAIERELHLTESKRLFKKFMMSLSDIQCFCDFYNRKYKTW